MMKKPHCAVLCILSVILTAWVCQKIGRNGAYTNAEELIIPPSKTYFANGKYPARYISVKGSWRIIDDKVYYPKSIIEYSCWEPSGECRVFEADVKENSLITYSDIKQIIKWDNEKIIIGSKDENSADCRHETIIVDLLTEEVTSITKNAENRDRQFCDKLISPLDKPRKAILIDPQKEYFSEKYKR